MKFQADELVWWSVEMKEAVLNAVFAKFELGKLKGKFVSSGAISESSEKSSFLWIWSSIEHSLTAIPFSEGLIFYYNVNIV
jgi:hypothetical protein